MANARCENGRFFFDYPEGPSREVKLSINTANGSNLIEVVIADENSVNKANPIRLKGVDGGQMVGADFPTSLDGFGGIVVVDGGGVITNG